MTEPNKDPNQDPNPNDPNRPAPDKGEKMVPKFRFDEVNEKRKAAEAELQSVADSLKEEVPESHRDLIPDLPPAALIKWIRTANAKGLFSTKAVEPVDGGRRPNSKQTPNLEGLSPQSKMALGYGKK